MESIRIRPAEPGDARGIAHVHVESWRTTYRGIVADEVLARLSEDDRAAFWRGVLDSSNSPGHLYVATDDDIGVVGFASGGPERDRVANYSSELFAIYLLSSHQRRGLGQRLAAAVARGLALDGHSSMVVWVLARNPSREFYAALGGRLVASKAVEIGPDTLEEKAYGWQDLGALIRRLEIGTY